MQPPTIERQGLIDYVRILPTEYHPGTDKHPVLVFFHGIDGRRSPEYLLSNEIPTEIQAWADAARIIILCPQTKTYFGREHIDSMILAAAKLTTSKIRLITGLSFGGGGLLSVLSIPGMAGLFKAAVVVCGVRSEALGNCELAKSGLPVLFFHAADDAVVLIRYSGTPNFEDLVRCGGKPLFITFPDGNHWIYGRVYNKDNFYPIEDGKPNESVLSWMLSKTIAAAPAPTFSIKMPPDFTTKTTGFKIKAEAEGEEWDTNGGAAWEVISAPTGVNKWHVVTAGGGWIEVQGIATVPGQYKLRLYLRSKTGKKANKDIVVTYAPEGTPAPAPKPIFTEFDHNGQHFIIFEDKTREIK